MNSNASPSVAPCLTFDIRKNYSGFSLECAASFPRGITAIFGPSGSGKTTLLDCIAGMVSPDTGKIDVYGAVVFSSKERIDMPLERRRLGYVFQHGALFPHLSARDNIAYGYDLTPMSERTVEIDRLVELLGLSSIMDRGIANLSGGERQRVALARALATSPRLLLLDEPLASLDAAYRASILTYLKKLAAELDTPMVFVSHSLSEVMALAPQTMAIADGRVVAYGPTPEVMAHPEVAAFADYATLENILEARVIEVDCVGGTSLLSVGDAILVGPHTEAVPSEDLVVSIRAGDVILSMGVPPLTSARNAVPAVVRDLREAGGRALVEVDIGERMLVEVTPASAAELRLRAGLEVYLVLKSSSILIFRTNTDLRTDRR